MSSGPTGDDWVRSQADHLQHLDNDSFDAGAAALEQVALERNEALLPIRVGLILRSRAAFSSADRLFDRLSRRSNLRHLALWELAISRALQGDPEGAVANLDLLTADGELSPHALMFAAVQRARIGQIDQALKMLDEVGRRDPSLETERSANTAFVRFLGRYPRERAREMLDEITGLFAPASTAALEALISGKLAAREPFLLLRMGDGEGAHIRMSADDEREFGALYRENRKEFLDIWFRDTSVIDDPAFDAAIDRFNAVIPNADYLGSFSVAAIEHEYGLGSRRGIAWVVNTMRKVLEAADKDPAWASRTGADTLTVHYDLLASGAIGRLLQGRAHVGVITCHDELGPALERRYGIGRVELHKVPGEQIHAHTLGAAAVAGRHWPDRFEALSAELEQGDRRGQLFLVAAGMLGKIYADQLKSSGAVVIDIGAVADLLLAKDTRVFPDSTRPFVLAEAGSAVFGEGGDRLTLVDVGGLGGIQDHWTPYLDRIRPIVFEPNPSEAALIRASIEATPGGQVIEKALGDVEGVRRLHITKSLGCTSLLIPNRALLSRYSVATAFDVVREIDVTCTRYDTLHAQGIAPRPDVIKIDVQGFEYEVLEGFGDLLKGCLGVQVEAHFAPIYTDQKLLSDLVELLGRSGLALRKISPVDHFDGDLVEVDAWFTCDIDRTGELTQADRAKLQLIERAWGVPPRRKVFQPSQFG